MVGWICLWPRKFNLVGPKVLQRRPGGLVDGQNWPEYAAGVYGYSDPNHSMHICVSDRPPARLPGKQLLRRLAMAPTPATPLALVDQLVADHAVMVFSKTTCPFCTKIKNMFAEKNVKIEVLELNQLSELPTELTIVEFAVYL